MAIDIELVSLNVRGLRDKLKRLTLFRHFKKHYKNAIIMLQETHSQPDDEIQWKREWEGDIRFGHFASDSRGVCTLFPPGYDFQITSEIKDIQGRILILSVHVDVNEFCIANVYAPTKNNDALRCNFLNELWDHVRDLTGFNFIIGGDFNITLNPKLDKMGGTNEKTSNYWTLVTDFMTDAEISDFWRKKNPGVKQYTCNGSPQTV